MKLKLLMSALTLTFLSSCTKTESLPDTDELEMVVNENELETETTTEMTYEIPENYTFTRNGVSTVFYTGQTARLKMATELKSGMNDTSFSTERLKNMFNSGTGFVDSSLDETGKNVGGKTAASILASATVKPLFDGWIDAFTTVVAPAVVSDTTAELGIAGSYTEADGSRTVKVTAKGLELNQVFSKGLIGALQMDQIVNNYLSFSKLDGAREDNDNQAYAYTYPGESEASITKMEHYWDEGFGYLQGLDSQFTPGLGDTETGKDTANLNYYLNKVNAQANEEGITNRIYQAFTAGRAAIVNKDYEERDKQAAIISAELSKVIGHKAQSYLVDGAEDISNGDWADALHALSEAYGFILGLQFTKDSTGNPYMTNQEVNALLERLTDGSGGFWERTPEELTAMANEVALATGLTLP